MIDSSPYQSNPNPNSNSDGVFLTEQEKAIKQIDSLATQFKNRNLMSLAYVLTMVSLVFTLGRENQLIGFLSGLAKAWEKERQDWLDSKKN